MDYKSIPSHPKYEASIIGDIRRIGKQFPLKPWIHSSGHLYVKLNNKSRQVHHLIMEAHGKPRIEGLECRHLDGNPANNQIENLKWGSRSENIMDFINHNGKSMGHKSTKVSIAQKIKQEHDGKFGTGKKLAEKYGVSVYTVSEIRSGKTFKYIEI
jgi:hypothetical protein